MKPLITKIKTSKGDVISEIRQFKTVYTLDGMKHEGINKLLTQFSQHEAVRTHILQQERATILRHYAAAVKPKTAIELISELSDLGVETQSIRIPCAKSDCDQVSIESLGHYLQIAEIAAEAEYACDFTDGLCPVCYEQEQRENAEEEIARNRHEAREEAYNA
jgi:hypothetical protein